MKKEVWGWILLAFAAITLNCVRLGGPTVSDDSFQYMSIAENLAEGNGIRTSIVHFDTERSHGELPAPSTWFPAGYPAAIALLSLAGVSRIWAGFVVSSISVGALALITAWLCSWYRLSVLATRLVLFCLVFNTWTLLYGGAVLTESLFTAVSLGAIAMLAGLSEQTGKHGQPHRAGLWALCGLMIGISAWVRYAGLFVYVSLVAFLAAEVLFRRRRDLRGPAAALVTATVLLAILFLRNVFLVGNWRGGNSIHASVSIARVVRKFVVAAYELFFGELIRARFGAAEVIVILAGGMCTVLVVRAVLNHREAVARSLEGRPSLAPVLSYVIVYLAALVWVSFVSHLGFSYRYCYPLLPLLLLLIGLLVTLLVPHGSSAGTDRVALASAVVLLGCSVFLNARNTLFPWGGESIFADRRVAEYLEAPMASGASLRSWIEANMPGDRNIVAANGQATAYVLHRQTVSLVGQDNSDYQWGESQVRQVMTQFDADFLILYPGAPPGDAPDMQAESKFLGDLVADEKSTDWLDLAAENAYVKVFRRNGPAERGASRSKGR